MNSNFSRTRLTYREYVSFPDDGNRHEVIDGDHYMNPAPTPNHQSVLAEIHFQLFSQVNRTGLGRVLFAPIDVHLTEFDVVQPDLVVVLKANRIITPVKIKGSPDHVIEILSSSTRKNDLELKRLLYEKTGVKEYWIVDPEEQALQQLVLSDGKYQEREHGDIVSVTYLTGVSVDLREVW